MVHSADLNECEINSAICGVGSCINMEGNFTCVCPDGHMLMADNRCMGKWKCRFCSPSHNDTLWLARWMLQILVRGTAILDWSTGVTSTAPYGTVRTLWRPTWPWSNAAAPLERDGMLWKTSVNVCLANNAPDLTLVSENSSTIVLFHRFSAFPTRIHFGVCLSLQMIMQHFAVQVWDKSLISRQASQQVGLGFGLSEKTRNCSHVRFLFVFRLGWV